jgi:hypothetical protein
LCNANALPFSFSLLHQDPGSTIREGVMIFIGVLVGFVFLVFLMLRWFFFLTILAVAVWLLATM